MSDHDLAGRSLGDRYDVLELLGTGGMGAVYRARDRELDEIVALKVIRGELAESAASVDRFRSEVKLARRVTHQNVARTFELGHADGVMFCTMELVEGESLTKRIRRDRKLAVADAASIACAVCDGLTAAHARDVIHRDIKPDNVLLSSDGRVVVADFGVAAVTVADGELSGTPAYMAPEQALGEPPTPAVDVYSVGVMLHEMLTGRAAFSGTALEILADKMTVERIGIMPGELPPELAEVIGRATAREPAHRFATAGALRRALEPWAKPARARTASTAPPNGSANDRIPEITTVIVVAPTGERSPRFYLAEAVHEEVVTRLGRIPRVRPQPRVNAEREPGDVLVTFTAGDRLEVMVEQRGIAIAQLSVPLAIHQIELAAATIAEAIASAISLTTIESNESHVDHALDLMFRARHVAIREMGNVQEAMAMLNKAQQAAPNNPKIAAMLAISQVRLAFFMGALDPAVLRRAGELARQAVAAAPDQVLAHLAMGHYELMTGDSALAAGHFRVAIACAPHSAEAHEQLGRMLLEAGYLDQAIERLEDAIAINPNVRTARWEIARAYALEQRWDDNDRLVSELRAMGVDRPIARARYAWWRRDIPTLVELREQFAGVQQLFMPGVMEEFIATFVDGDWPLRKQNLLKVAASLPPNRRRRAFVGQMIAEAAGFWNDVPTALECIEFAIGEGLFDLHWLDRCTLLEPVRKAPEFPALRTRIKRRADAILDALYGDHHIGVSETAVAD